MKTTRNGGCYMKKHTKKLLAVLIVIVMASGLIPLDAGAATVVSITGKTVASAQSDIQKAINDLGSATDTVTVTGSISGATAIMTLTISSNVTVNWVATYSGTANPLIDLKGEGIFDVKSSGSIANTSPTGSTTALKASVDGNVDIIVSGGTVAAGLGCAIEGAGKTSTVTVTGGYIYNYATHNLRPVINMTWQHNPALASADPPNVIVTGGEVSARADSAGAYGYGIQTYGNIVIGETGQTDAGLVYTKGEYGRGINIVGINSKATIKDGATIYATGRSGVAVSTATTTGVDVTNTEVEVTGGLIYANEGMAIRTMGKQSKVKVGGKGVVIAYGAAVTGNGNVIFTQNNAANGFLPATDLTVDAIVIAWNQAAGRVEYEALKDTHLAKLSAGAPATVQWAHNPAGNYDDFDDGINYVKGTNTGYLCFRDDLKGFTPVRVDTYAASADKDEYKFEAIAGWMASNPRFPPAYNAPYPRAHPTPADTPDDTEIVTITNTGSSTINLTAALDLGADSRFTIVSGQNLSVTGLGGTADIVIKYKLGTISSPTLHTFTEILRISDDAGMIPDIIVNLTLVVKPIHRIITSTGGTAGPSDQMTPIMKEYVHGGKSDEYAANSVGGATLSYIDILDANVTDLSNNPPYLRIEMLHNTDKYTFTNITRDYIIRTIYVPIGSPHNIIAFAGEGGYFNRGLSTILNPSNPFEDFTVKANPGYSITDVRVNTTSVLLDPETPGVQGVQNTEDDHGHISSLTYRFTDMLNNHWITATFERSMYKIDISRNDGGQTSFGTDKDVQGEVWVNIGDNATVEIVPSDGFRIASVTVDGVRLSGPTLSFVQFPDMDDNHIIDVIFVPLSSEVEPEDPPADLPPSPPPRPDTGDGDVSHILNTEHHNQYVRGVASNKRTTGVEFQPNRDMTRAEVAQMFYNLLLEQNVPITERFPDEPLTAWHEKAVHTMASLGIIQGYPDGSFRPEGSVTRAEFVVFAARFAKTLPQAEHLAFHDVPETHWAYEHINAAVQFGWITGYSDGSFQPSRRISRAEAVTIVNRMLGRVADKDFIDSHSSIARFVDVPQTHWAFYDIMEAYNAHDYDMRDTGEHWVE